MVKLKLHINIPEPCDKGWDNMVPNAGGRHCDSCEKTVIDFTAMTDDELVQFFINAKGKPICGHYLQTQVNRDIYYTPPAKRIMHLSLAKKIAAGILLLQALATDARAQARKLTTTVAVPQDKSADKKPVVLKGKLTDQTTGLPIPGMTITVPGTTLNDTTNRKGEFAITLPDSMPGLIKFTAHYNDGKEPPATEIYSEDFTYADVLAGKTANIYRYPAGEIDEVKVVSYRIPLIDGGMGVNVVTKVTSEPLPGKGLWNRIKRTFSKKPKSDQCAGM